MTSIGSQLRAERTRLGFSQADFAAMGAIATRTQVSYEKGESFPGADYLSLIAHYGADVTFIILGNRDEHKTPLSTEEEFVLGAFRTAPPVLKVSVLASLKAAYDFMLVNKA